MELKTFCFKLYKSKKNKRLHRSFFIASKIYNHCIALHKRYFRLFHKSLNRYKLQKHITKLKKMERFNHWNELGSQAIQDITERIDKGYNLFFRNLKHKIRTAPPSFRKSKKYKSFTLKQAGFKVLAGNKIKILGAVYKFHKSREIEGKIKTLTVKRDALGDIYLYFACEQEKSNEILARTGKSVGFDFGLKLFLTGSNGEEFAAPLFFKQNQKLIKKANRTLSKKKKGSRNRRKARLALARLHKKVANQRRQFHYELANFLVQEYAIICLEDLNIKAMQRLWGKKISDLGHSQFVAILAQQAAKVGTNVIEIPRFYPSSKTCFECGYVLDELPLKIRHWVCPNCGAGHERDKNAAKNIERVGATTRRREEVRPA